MSNFIEIVRPGKQSAAVKLTEPDKNKNDTVIISFDYGVTTYIDIDKVAKMEIIESLVKLHDFSSDYYRSYDLQISITAGYCSFKSPDKQELLNIINRILEHAN